MVQDFFDLTVSYSSQNDYILWFSLEIRDELNPNRINLILQITSITFISRVQPAKKIFVKLDPLPSYGWLHKDLWNFQPPTVDHAGDMILEISPRCNFWETGDYPIKSPWGGRKKNHVLVESYNSNSTHTFPIQNWLKTFNFRSSCVFLGGVASQDFMGAFPEKNTTPLHLWPNQNKASIVFPQKKSSESKLPKVANSFFGSSNMCFFGEQKTTATHQLPWHLPTTRPFLGSKLVEFMNLTFSLAGELRESVGGAEDSPISLGGRCFLRGKKIFPWKCHQ